MNQKGGASVVSDLKTNKMNKNISDMFTEDSLQEELFGGRCHDTGDQLSSKSREHLIFQSLFLFVLNIF